MSMNKFMHPRNIYKSPPDFKQLAVDFPEFRNFVQLDISGKVSLDFKNVESLRALTCTLLKKDFGLDVSIPLTKLIPTIPLRLNYILWIEDLLEVFGIKDPVRGVDIGTGASCVYPLLGAKKNGWKFSATEIDSESVKIALENVKRNSLDNLIDVLEVKDDGLIINLVQDSEYDFCMCNPPFFSNKEELHPFFKARTKNRPHPKNAFVASDNEVIASGGEVDFITKLINESKQLKNKETEFCQGNTTRWGLAWTYEEINLRKAVDPVKIKSNKSKPPVTHSIPIENMDETHLNKVTDELMKMFKNLKFLCEEVSRNKQNLRYFVSAFSNTWSNQRRKRREEKRLNNSDSSMEENQNNNDEETSQKRPREPLEGTLMKRLRLSSNESDMSEVFFKFVLSVKQEKESVVLELNCQPETENRDHLYQILQYIKNNFKMQ
ncbi:unnamed protein product [Brassicogethes aeneus]|uniref:U6 small nuclear RNA (adenine-(43)-N(6))-methyltransferase n=1 Tax=Brassicogethes aeneus TaxID=1431903 RepID=A0A9P0B095_BRAAE|nr:unnamed protein product [Brassicogethes aeneus]